MYALVFSFVVGLGLSFLDSKNLKATVKDFGDIVMCMIALYIAMDNIDKITKMKMPEMI